MSSRPFISAMLFAVSACVAGLSHAATISTLANGGFELVGTPPQPAAFWSTAASGYTRSTDARSGSFSAQLMSPTTNAAVMLQDTADNGLAPSLDVGDTPLLSFWSKGFAGSTGNAQFALRYLSGDGTILANSGIQFFHLEINPDTWTEITFDSDAIPVGTESVFIEFTQAIGPIDDVNLAGTVLVDDVNLSVVSAIPEPSSCAVLALAGITVVCRRRRRR